MTLNGDLQVGLTNTSIYEVTAEMGPPHLDVVVLSTPWMLGLVEMTSLRAIREHLAADRTIVGTGATLTHDAAAKAGENVSVTSTLIAVGRRLTFEATVTLAPRGAVGAVGAVDADALGAVDGRSRAPRVVGTVTLESAVIDTARFAR